jgi:hypothetical protein
MAVSFWGLTVLSILAPAAAEGGETGAALPWTIVGLAVAGCIGAVVGLGGYWLWSRKNR